MEHKLFHQMSQLEEVHWWFVGRRAILDALIKRLALPNHATILEAGCGTGGNLAMLNHYGKVSGIEYDTIARELSVRRQIGTIVAGCLPNILPFREQQFDMVALFDVLEHLKEDIASLKALRSRLKSNGWLILTVPANPWMWSDHDVVHHHKRRYTLRHLCRVVKTAGYQITYVSYFNFLLFPLIAAIRISQKWQGKQEERSDLTLPSKFLNSVLTLIFSSEKYAVANRVSIPFGVSLILIARPSR